MLEEVLARRFARGKAGSSKMKSPSSKLQAPSSNQWPTPDLILIDGGKGQLNVAKRVLETHGLDIPLVGIAKGIDRKQDELVYDKKDNELARLVRAFKPLLQQVRDEAHRFAVAYHRKLRRGRN
jgi:excinuclease ABC subunit C